MTAEAITFGSWSKNVPDSMAPKIRATPGHTFQVTIDSQQADTGNAYSFGYNLGLDGEAFSRILPTSIHAQLSIPNVNIRNNEVIITFAGSPWTHRVGVIPVGYYSSSDFFKALTDAMSDASPGITFAYTYDIPTQAYTITSSGDHFQFESCTLKTKGKYTIDLPIADGYAASKTIYSAALFYTPYVLVQASRLLPNDGNLSYTAGAQKYDYFTSFYLPTPTSRRISLGAVSGGSANAQYTARSDKTSSSFAVRLLDAFGEPLEAYCPRYTDNFFIMTVSIVR